jgi:hypothetical protein
MTSERVIRTALIICLLLSLLAYHLIGALIEPNLSRAFYDVYKIAQITVTGILFFLLVYSSFATKIFLRDKYISGTYRGESLHYRDTSSQEPHIELFTIKQNLFDAQITGKSLKKESKELVSLWNAKLYRVEGNTFYFAMELSTEKIEFGVLQTNFENGKVHGFYYSGELGSKYASSFWAEKIDGKAAKKLLKEFDRSNLKAKKSA